MRVPGVGHAVVDGRLDVVPVTPDAVLAHVMDKPGRPVDDDLAVPDVITTFLER